jgi:uncharacterized membrane protein
MTLFLALLAAFIVSHIALATPPLRDQLVRRLGEKGFGIGYSILSLVLLFAAIDAYRGTPDRQLWTAGPGVMHAANLVMLFAAILFAGSLTPANKALAGVPMKGPASPSGVMRITRHPMMWAFGLWAMVHVAVSGNLPTVMMAAGLGVLALVGSAFQDAKKRKALGADWVSYQRQTSFWPLGAQLTGRQPWSSLWPGLLPVGLGIAIWLVATWLHPMLMKAPAVGIWAGL